MRVSSNTPALSRRSIMKGLACGLAGASVPVAAIAGITASRLSRDAPLLEKCTRWKQRREELDAKEQQLRILSREAEKNVPPVPADLFQSFHLTGVWWASPYQGNLSSGRFAFSKVETLQSDNPVPWTKAALGNVLKGRPGLFEGAKTVPAGLAPTRECREHIRRLIRLIDERTAVKDAAWLPHKCLDRQWARQLSKNDQLLSDIMDMEAQTLQGVAAQIELLQMDDHFSDMNEGSERADALMTNVRRLIAALPVEA